MLSTLDPEGRIAVGERAPIFGDEPIAAAVGRRCHRNDRSIEVEAARGPIEMGIAETEYPAVSPEEPVALPVGGGSETHDGGIEWEIAHVSVVQGLIVRRGLSGY